MTTYTDNTEFMAYEDYDYYPTKTLMYEDLIMNLKNGQDVVIYKDAEDEEKWAEVPKELKQTNYGVPSNPTDCDYIFKMSETTFESYEEMKEELCDLWEDEIYSMWFVADEILKDPTPIDRPTELMNYFKKYVLKAIISKVENPYGNIVRKCVICETKGINYRDVKGERVCLDCGVITPLIDEVKRLNEMFGVKDLFIVG